MSKTQAYTYVTCPLGTRVELYTDTRPKIGQTFKVLHMDTKKVVHRAKVESIEDLSRKTPQPLRCYKVIASIIE